MEYKLVIKNGPVEDEVNKLIKEGYKPLGGVSMASVNGKIIMSQAMTRTAKQTGKKHFKPPTLREVADYIKEKDYRVNPEAFMAHNEKVDWKTTKGVKISSWKGCIGTWQFNTKGDKDALNIPKSKAFKAEVVDKSKQLNGEQVAALKRKMMNKSKESDNDK